MTRHIDLDARLVVARAEAGLAEDPTILFRGRIWHLPPDLPIEFLTAVNRPGSDGTIAAIMAVLGPTVAELDPSIGVREATLLAEALPELYGMTSGEAEASPSSSSTGGTSARPTSPATTASTSPGPSAPRRPNLVASRSAASAS